MKIRKRGNSFQLDLGKIDRRNPRARARLHRAHHRRSNPKTRPTLAARRRNRLGKPQYIRDHLTPKNKIASLPARTQETSPLSSLQHWTTKTEEMGARYHQSDHELMILTTGFAPARLTADQILKLAQRWQSDDESIWGEIQNS